MDFSQFAGVLKTDINLMRLLLSLFTGFVLGYLLRWHYVKFGQAINNRSQFSRLFINLILTVTLIIALIKTSLALSLGLIGALSIVRFRTPIKDPEELVYLFFAIAIGLGLGANQILATVIASIVIMIMGVIVRHSKDIEDQYSIYCTLNFPSTDSNQEKINKITELLKKESNHIDIKQIELANNNYMLTVLTDFNSPNSATNFVNEVNKFDSSISISLIDKSRIPAL